MPIDFLTNLPYTIDYDRMMRSIENFPMFSNKILQKNYLNHWKNQLIKVDTSLLKKHDTPDYLISLIKNFKIRECFQQSIIYDNNIPVIINFNIELLIQLIEKTQQNTKYIDLNYFEPSRNFITWTPPSDLPKKSLITSDEILLTPFYNARAFTYLVLDGNHRIAHAIYKKSKTIKATIINPIEMLNNNYFQSEFDRLFFIFQNEIYYMYHCRKNYKLKDKDLLARSYLTNHQFNFLEMIPEFEF